MTIEEYNTTVSRFSDNLYRFILKNINDSEKAKDIVQDSYEKLWINRNSINPEKTKSYLFTTAYHTMIDDIRKNKRITNFEDINQGNYTHSEQYSDLQEILHKAILQLPENQRAVVLLRDYEGYSYKEIAEITELTEAQVKTYIFRARLFLKDYIKSIENLV